MGCGPIRRRRGIDTMLVERIERERPTPDEAIRQRDRHERIAAIKKLGLGSRSSLAFNLGLHCHYCGHEVAGWAEDRGLHPTVDHMIPLKRGGRNTSANKVLACYRCNQEKGALTATDYIAWRQQYGHLTGAERKASLRVVRDHAHAMWHSRKSRRGTATYGSPF